MLWPPASDRTPYGRPHSSPLLRTASSLRLVPPADALAVPRCLPAALCCALVRGLGPPGPLSPRTSIVCDRAPTTVLRTQLELALTLGSFSEQLTPSAVRTAFAAYASAVRVRTSMHVVLADHRPSSEARFVLLTCEVSPARSLAVGRGRTSTRCLEGTPRAVHSERRTSYEGTSESQALS